ncbi:MAG: alpha-L-fucosidase [Clostridiales bacterium]|nr:alpha-L-fucosidase [Clostridiales bacterium]
MIYMKDGFHVAVPTKKILEWQELELGVLIHYIMDIYKHDCHSKCRIIADEIPPQSINPSRLDPAQWVRSAKEMGAKYAILVAKHGTGFALWPTDVNDYSCKYMPWKDGKGDIVGEFVDACRHYGLLPGLYYHPTCNGYYGINNELKYDYKSEMYQKYVRCVERQVEELWSRYGELFEVWFDGGTIPPEDGGPDLVPLLERYQPQAVAFQGPRSWPHVTRWVGNEDGLAPENCWASTNAGEARYDGSVPDEKAGVGDPDGIYYWPAETDMPNRDHTSFGGGWGWAKGEQDKCYSPEYLLDCYVRSVGRNSNMLLGMAISTEGDFEDEEQFRKFGALLEKIFGEPDIILTDPEPYDGCVTLHCDIDEPMAYLVVREDISEGQHIREFSVRADGKELYRSNCVGHKRIIPLNGLCAGTLDFKVEISAGDFRIRDIAVYEKRQ